MGEFRYECIEIRLTNFQTSNYYLFIFVRKIFETLYLFSVRSQIPTSFKPSKQKKFTCVILCSQI